MFNILQTEYPAFPMSRLEVHSRFLKLTENIAIRHIQKKKLIEIDKEM